MNFISISFSRSVRERAVSIIATLALFVSMASVAFMPHQALSAEHSLSTSELVALANEDRTDAGLGKLKVNQKLVAAAQAKANDMASKGYFAHTAPDGTDSWSWFKNAGYSYIRAGENLAVNFNDEEKLENAWMNSPTHRANIMNGKYTEVGIAYAVGTYKGKKTIFVAQMFGTPLESGSLAKSAPAATKTVTATPKKPTRVLGASAEATEIARLQAILANLQAQLKALKG